MSRGGSSVEEIFTGQSKYVSSLQADMDAYIEIQPVPAPAPYLDYLFHRASVEYVVAAVVMGLLLLFVIAYVLFLGFRFVLLVCGKLKERDTAFQTLHTEKMVANESYIFAPILAGIGVFVLLLYYVITINSLGIVGEDRETVTSYKDQQSPVYASAYLAQVMGYEYLDVTGSRVEGSNVVVEVKTSRDIKEIELTGVQVITPGVTKLQARWVPPVDSEHLPYWTDVEVLNTRS